MNKPFWNPLLASFGTMILLYTIGFIADINFLKIKISPSYTEISFLPVIVGLLIGFITERMIDYKSKKFEL
ncbi:ATPase [Anaerobacillus isosaccharinicus]|uniref:ATPase n=1 Tax=Anaerobacillus isosaccharinicus TaxID=1532552 RepID=A0A1S2M8Q3_9BACI|nr:ATPase [Anaerobacillus isosaccharinicus]MBA5588496.1 ATPase [Anaerobacillus isosaccharinicus]QOY38079.1 ATPase [Anaerobacillus isosaccharinicus]